MDLATTPQTQITQALAGVVFFIPVVLGLVEYSKRLGLAGRALLLLSLALGVLLGGGYWLVAFDVPLTPAAWFGLVVFGLMIGLTTSGVYDFVSTRFPKVEPLTEASASPPPIPWPTDINTRRTR
jgi:hypothetical protein